MKTFLEYIASDILKQYGTNLSRIAVVFPNKRAALFLNQALARLSDTPVWSPHYIAISDLFRQYSNLEVVDPVKAICELHLSYMQVTGKNEPLDQFCSWGQLLLSDFDDIDKNLADAQMVFGNVRDLHEYDDISYLSTEQRKLLKRFFSNFQDQDSRLKKRFLELWNRLYDIYQDFRNRLRKQGLAYEGMLYRDVALSEDLSFDYECYLFVGFNVLHAVEQTFFRRLKIAGKARFYWDYDQYYTQDTTNMGVNEAGVYIRKYLQMFPNELAPLSDEVYQNLAKPKDITYICSPTEDLQCRYVAEWLQDPIRCKADIRTAVVLCNEGMLPTVLHCIPSEVGALNVTTGFPLQQTPVATLIEQLFTLLQSSFSSRHQAFRLRVVSALLRHPYAKLLSPLAADVLRELIGYRQFYIPVHELKRDEGLTLLFDIEQLRALPSGNSCAPVLSWMKAIVERIARQEGTHADPLFQESMFRMYTLLNRLADVVGNSNQIADLTTLQRFVRQLVSTTTIPFHGEPAVGIQVMGVLETRNLDFDHVLILSCNEGYMPKGVDDASFIPHALRKAYGLTTVDNKVAIYSYYFHRLLQRAQDVTILYSNAIDNSHAKEMSRFMLQLLVELGHPIKRLTLQTGQTPTYTTPVSVEKDEKVIEHLLTFKIFSPTAINRYMRCPLSFFYCYVAGINEPENRDDDNIDNRVFGNIFHRAAELMYETLLPRQSIEKQHILSLLNAPKSLDPVISQAFSEELFRLPKGTVKHPPLNGLQLINREVIDTYLRHLLQTDLTLVPFQVVGHEQKVYYSYAVQTPKGVQNIKIGGRIDRLDLIQSPDSKDGQLRVVDYKTGNRLHKNVNTVSEVFDSGNIRAKHSDYIFQTMLYSILLGRQQDRPVSPALLFIQHAMAQDYQPVLTLGGEPITDIIKVCGDSFEKLLKEKLEEIFDLERPFLPTTDRAICATCAYKSLCGR